MLRSCPPTLPCLSNNFASLWQLVTPCLHGATSEHPHPMSPWSHPLSIVKLSLTEDSPERVLNLMKSENNAGLSAGHHVLLKHWRTQACWARLMPPLTLKVIGHQLSTHRASQGLWPTSSCRKEKREMEVHPMVGLQVKGTVLEASGWLETNAVTYLSLSVSKLWNWGDGSNCYLWGPGGNQGQGFSENRDY